MTSPLSLALQLLLLAAPVAVALLTGDSFIHDSLIRAKNTSSSMTRFRLSSPGLRSWRAQS